jgi:hypothetical protein
MEETTVKQTVPEESGTAAPAVQQEEKKHVTNLLGGFVSYTDPIDYEKFLDALTLEHAVLVLIASANYAQSRGIFILPEAELINRCVTRLKKAQTIPILETPANPTDGGSGNIEQPKA